MRAVILLAIICVLASASGQSNDIIDGTPAVGDVVLYKSHEVKWGIPLLIRRSYIMFPSPLQPNYAKISSVHVRDKVGNGYGGYPSIVRGGVGNKHVHILLESQRSYGFNFTVTIYGRY